MTSAPTAVQNRIDTLFQKCRQERRAALILYITSGFPSREVTEAALPILAENGCDLIELGVPFSDPIADGPVIQKASTVALEKGMTFPQTLEILTNFRQQYETPVVLFGALNPFLRRGLTQAADLARACGADGILSADLPHEEAEEFRAILSDRGLHLITLLAPTTPDARARAIAASSSGFLYCISYKGTTGKKVDIRSVAEGYLARLRQQTSIPLALGFGVSTPEDVRSAVAAGADGVVVGTALINMLEKVTASGEDLKTTLGAWVRSLAAELKR